jgi:tetratricopeptide (TPR) repeat protein
MEVMLNQSFPGTKFEVINTGTTAINSHVILPIVKELAKHQPDMFVVYAGSNEIVGPYGPGTVLTTPSSSRAIIRASILLKSTRISQLITRMTSRSAPSQSQSQWRGMEMFLDQQVRFNSPQLGPVYDNFAENLREIIHIARNSGSRVIVSTIATNLRDCAPFASLHREGLGKHDLEKWTLLVQQGTALDEAGSYKEALGTYRSAEVIDPEYAELQFRIARCLWHLEEYDAARERFVRAQDLDTLHFRADSRTNSVIRSVTAPGGSEAELVDAAQSFSKESPHATPGSELLQEHVHMNPEGNYLLARVMVLQIASKLSPGGRGAVTDPGIPSQAECDRRLALTRYDRARLAKLVLRKLERAPFTNQISNDEEKAKLSADSELPADSYDETLSQYRWAIDKNPDDRMLHLNYGFLLYQEYPMAATQELQRALPYDSAPVLCNWRKLE